MSETINAISTFVTKCSIAGKGQQILRTWFRFMFPTQKFLFIIIMYELQKSTCWPTYKISRNPFFLSNTHIFPQNDERRRKSSALTMELLVRRLSCFTFISYMTIFIYFFTVSFKGLPVIIFRRSHFYLTFFLRTKYEKLHDFPLDKIKLCHYILPRSLFSDAIIFLLCAALWCNIWTKKKTVSIVEWKWGKNASDVWTWMNWNELSYFLLSRSNW